jgi:geranylgeranylglycerol-phosphate geranylgeranyltransferase
MERERLRYGPIIELTRPQNCLIAGASVLVGAAMAGWHSSFGTIVVATVAAMMITGAANALNDIFDVEKDRVNKPHRPLPSGRATRGEAAALSAILFALGLLGSAVVGFGAFLIAVGVSVALAGYAVSTALQGVLGNFIVSGATGMALVYGAIAGGGARAALFPALFAFLITLGREAIKDAEDVEGDRPTGVRSLAIIAGPETAMRFAATVLLILVVLTPLPFVLGWYRLPYLVVVSILDLLLIVLAVAVVRVPSKAKLGRMSLLLKIGIVIGIVALFLGG